MNLPIASQVEAQSYFQNKNVDRHGSILRKDMRMNVYVRRSEQTLFSQSPGIWLDAPSRHQATDRRFFWALSHDS